jgi:hypothetical protein
MSGAAISLTGAEYKYVLDGGALDFASADELASAAITNHKTTSGILNCLTPLWVFAVGRAKCSGSLVDGQLPRYE